MAERKTLVKATPWYESKTIWFGIMQMLLALIDLASSENLLGTNPTILFVVGLVAVILRYVTKTPMTFTGTEAKPVPAPGREALFFREAVEEHDGDES